MCKQAPKLFIINGYNDNYNTKKIVRLIMFQY